MEKLQVQVAFQGGGAKLGALLGAAAALRDLELAPGAKFEVTRVAGTSAGAIAATLYALKNPGFVEARRRLGAIDKARFQRDFPELGLMAVLKIAFDKPIYDRQRLRLLLEEVLRQRVDTQKPTPDLDPSAPKKKRNNRPPDSGDLRIPLVVTTADLRNHRSVQRTFLPAGNETLVETVVASCTLPLVFASSADEVVDGGVCQNLPVACLLPYAPKDGPVICYSFEARQPSSPRKGPFVLIDVVDTALEHSVLSAQQHVGEPRVVIVPTSLDSTQFHLVLDYLQEEWETAHAYSTLRSTEAIASLVPRQALFDNVWRVATTATRQMMESLGRVTAIERKYVLHLMRLVYQYGNKANNVPPDHPQHVDKVSWTHEFSVSEEPLTHYVMSLGSADDAPQHAEWSVSYVEAGVPRSIPVTTIPIFRPDLPAMKSVVLFFDTPLTKAHNPYTIVQTDYNVDGLAAVRRAGVGRDYLRAGVPAAGVPKAERVEIIFRFDLAGQFDLTAMRAADVPLDGFKNHISGRLMDEAELRAATGDGPAFQMGWRSPDNTPVTPGKWIGTWVVRREN